MRSLLAILLVALSTPALADPTCVVTDRLGYSVPVHIEPDAAVKTVLYPGTVVELFTIANGYRGGGWALLRDPVDIANFYGWVDWRAVQCR